LGLLRRVYSFQLSVVSSGIRITQWAGKRDISDQRSGGKKKTDAEVVPSGSG
jgi:hypothetical protein